MKREEFIDDLVNLLVKVDKGMAEFDVPLPPNAEKSLMEAVISFREEALPILHKAIVASWSETDLTHVIDVLGAIGHASSAPYLIEFHGQHASFMSGTAAIQAMKNVKTQETYAYLGNLIVQQASGKNVFNTGAEIPLACEVLGDWNDEQAVPFLERAVTIHDPNHMPEMAIKQLVKYPSSHHFLHDLALRESSLKSMIEKAFQEAGV